MNIPQGPVQPALSLHEVLDQFKRALRAAGLDTDEALIADGELHRYRVEGDKKGSKNGFYVLHADGIPAGEFGSWKTGQKETWRADIGRNLSSEEEAAHRERIRTMQAARKLAEDKARAEARGKAARLWKTAAELVKATHPYLVAKGVRAYGIRQLKDALVVPVRDVDGALHGLQFIQPDGTKRFTTGMAKAGHYHAIGKPQGVVLIAEGYATAATLHEATGHAVACAFDAGNLLAVAQAIHAKRPALRLVLAADNDHHTESNPGLTKAQAAAAAVHGVVCLPAFAADAEGTDWNDYAALHGLAAVREAVAAQMAAGALEVAQGSGGHDAGASAHDAATASADAVPWAGSGKVLPFPAKGRSKGRNAAGDDAAAGGGSGRGGRGGGKPPDPSRPHFACDSEGVWWHDLDKDGTPMAAYWVCPRLDVRAYLRDVQNENWGRLLVFNDKDGREHRWGMPMRLLAGGCDEMRGELLRLGFDVPTAAKNRTLLVNYIQRAKPAVFARCVERTGWHDRVFVFPDHTIGETDELVLFQSESATPTHYRTRGELTHWRSDVAELCRGNSRLMLGVCVAFAGPLLAWAGEESGGFNIRGASSTGKSVSLHLAASVWGGPDFRKKWRTTDNAMESLAALHSDTVLPLDEMGEIDARIVGETVYMLAGGEGKARAGRAGGLRHTPTWRVVFLSTSEISLAEHMRQGGKKVQAGQDARVADVPADAGAGHGVFEALHGYDSGVKVAEAIKRLTGEQYGHAGPAYLQGLMPRLDTLPDVLRAQRDTFRTAHLPKSASGQSLRVAGRFALVAAAGELATEMGITGWEQGEATVAVARCMKDWAEERGGVGNLEPVRMIEQVRHFLHAHGTARFPMIGDGEKEGWVTVNHAGFREASVMSEMSYYVFAEVFEQQVCEGFDARAVARQLKAIGALRTDGQRLKVSKRLPGKGLVRCYHVLADIWEADAQQAA